MNVKLTQFSEDIKQHFAEIPTGRKVLLEKLATYLQDKLDSNDQSKLMFICTHNSRRSHFGQILSALAAEYYQIPEVQTFSAGTEVSAFHPNAITALRSIGLEIKDTENSSNPHFIVTWGPTHSLVAFSKLIDDEVNPKEHFAAIMTCTQAEQNCPYVAGAEFRLGLPFDDPKSYDGTAQESSMYLTRVHQMASEIYYVFSLLKK